MSSLLESRTTGRAELHGASDQDFRFDLVDGKSSNAGTRPVSATAEQRATASGRRLAA